VNLEKVGGDGFSLEELAAPEIRAKAPYEVSGRRSAGAPVDICASFRKWTAQVNEALENFRFHEACQTIYHFFWATFATGT